MLNELERYRAECAELGENTSLYGCERLKVIHKDGSVTCYSLTLMLGSLYLDKEISPF
jgi:hypothetical protein